MRHQGIEPTESQAQFSNHRTTLRHTATLSAGLPPPGNALENVSDAAARALVSTSDLAQMCTCCGFRYFSGLD